MIVGDLAAVIALDQKINLFGREFFPIAFPLDQVNCSHYETLSLAPQGAESKGKGAKKIALPAVRSPAAAPTSKGMLSFSNPLHRKVLIRIIDWTRRRLPGKL